MDFTTEEPSNKRMAALEDAAAKTARMLIGRSDVTVHVGSQPCYEWKTKRLFLPAYTRVASDLRLEQAWRGLMDHECAHVVHTDFNAYEAEQHKWNDEFGDGTAPRIAMLANAFEDMWIERRWAESFRGSREHFRVKNEYVVESTGGAGPTDPDWTNPKDRHAEPIGLWMAMVQAALRLGRGNIVESEIHPTTAAVMGLVRPEIEQGWASTNTTEACAAAEAVYRKLKDKIPPPPAPPPPPPPSRPSGAKPGQPEKGRGANPHGAGFGYHDEEALAAEACGGALGEVPTDADVIASKYISEMPPAYTVHPDAAAEDQVCTYDSPHDRDAGKVLLDQLRKAAGPAVVKLSSMLSGAVAAATQTLIIGGMEEGDDLDDLDDDAIPGIALGLENDAIFTTLVQQIKESSFVVVLVDCSGSMGSSTPSMRNGTPTIETKAGYAAVTAMALHRALQGAGSPGIPHAVLGYNTRSATRRHHANPKLPNGYREWTRSSSALNMHVFVPAPGLADDGAAIPFITGRGCNLDGESLLWAARYGALHGGECDRVIMLVVADGLPAGADDSRVEGPYLRDTVDRIARAGIEVYGIGTCIRDMDVFRSYYPDRRAEPDRAPTGCLEIKAKEGLTDGVLRRMIDLLTRGWGITRRGV